MPPGHHHGGSQALHGGVPWESSQGGFFSRWWETVTAANFKGREMFAAVAQSDDAMPACLFSMTTTAICGFVALMFFMLIYAVIGATVLGGLASLGGRGGAGAAFGVAGIGIVLMFVYVIVATIIYAVMGFILPWIGGGLHHLGLMVFGGVAQGKGYTDTVRAHAYAQAASLLWIMIPLPYLNSLISLVFSIINHVNAYDEVHRCGGGKAFLAWLSPLLLCCCCAFMAGMMSGVLSNM